MKKHFVYVFVLALLLTGCTKKIEKFYLDDIYYNDGNFITVDAETLNNIDDKNYLLYTYNNFCIFQIPCDDIFKSVMEKHNIDIIGIPFSEFKNTRYYDKVKFAPSVIIIKNGEIVAYLDAESDEDFNRYQDVNEFESWLNEFIYLTK